MPRAGLTTAGVVDAAIDLIDERGIGALTLAAVAEGSGVAAPSLYKHVASLAGLRALVAARVMDELTRRFSAAVLGLGRDEAVAALMRSYRGYVLEHAARYAAMPHNPLQDPALADAGGRLLNVFLGALKGYGLSDAEAIHATRCLRASVHGFAVIEASGGFGLPPDLDESYERLIRMFISDLRRSKRRSDGKRE